jgi:hypothetical protein
MMDFLESFVISHSGLDQVAHFLQHEGGHEWKPYPFCPVFKALSAFLRFLFFFVVDNLAATSAAT